MTADENAAIMRRAYAAFNSADLNTLNELFDEGAVWHLPGRSRFADDYQGREATFAYFGQLGQETGGTFGAQLQHLLADDGDRVVGIQRQHRRAGRQAPRCCQLHRVRAQGRQSCRRSGALSRPLRVG